MYEFNVYPDNTFYGIIIGMLGNCITIWMKQRGKEEKNIEFRVKRSVFKPRWCYLLAGIPWANSLKFF